jgi:(2Fe-2S) ferredoxin
MGQYERHVFVCTFGKTCSTEGGEEVLEELKHRVKAAGLKKTIRVNRAGCMNQCGHGPMVVVYPENVWYARVDVRGARRIAEEHLDRGRIVRDYLYVAPPGDNKRA